MSVPIIAKTAAFTFLVAVFLLSAAVYYGTVELFICAALMVMIFLLVLDMFEREAARKKRRV